MLRLSFHRFLRLAAGALVTTALLSPLPVGAHHGWGGNQQEHFELTGTVETPVSVAGPHATMRVRAADGQVWDITLGPRARTERSGLREGVVPAGATVTLYGHRNRDANRFEMKTERVVWNDRAFEVYPNRD